MTSSYQHNYPPHLRGIGSGGTAPILSPDDEAVALGRLVVELLDHGQLPGVLVDAELVERVTADDGVVEDGVELRVRVHRLHLPDDRLARPVNVLTHLNTKIRFKHKD